MNEFALLDRATAARSQAGNSSSGNQRQQPASSAGIHPLLLTAQQVADLLGTSKRQVWRLESAGRIPKPLRLGGRLVRWRWTELVEFVDRLDSEPANRLGRA